MTMSETTTEKPGDAWETVARAADSWARMDDAWATSVAAGENCRPEDVVAARDRADAFRKVAADIRALPDLRALVADLAALNTADEWLADGCVESPAPTLDTLILRARALTA